jgi:hypothetical protein
MFAVLHSDVNSPRSGLLHFTDQPYCKNSRSAKVKDAIINLILKNYFVDRYTSKNNLMLIIKARVPCQSKINLTRPLDYTNKAPLLEY